MPGRFMLGKLQECLSDSRGTRHKAASCGLAACADWDGLSDSDIFAWISRKRRADSVPRSAGLCRSRRVCSREPVPALSKAMKLKNVRGRCQECVPSKPHLFRHCLELRRYTFACFVHAHLGSAKISNHLNSISSTQTVPVKASYKVPI
jgi:hypothetical protein